MLIAPIFGRRTPMRSERNRKDGPPKVTPKSRQSGPPFAMPDVGEWPQCSHRPWGSSGGARGGSKYRKARVRQEAMHPCRPAVAKDRERSPLTRDRRRSRLAKKAGHGVLLIQMKGTDQ